MWVSAREAVRILAPVVSGDAQAKALLRAGLAGAALETARGPLYDDDLVVALARRAPVDEAELGRVCPRGLYLTRLKRGVVLDLRRPWAEVAEQVTAAQAGQRPLTALSAALLGVRSRLAGSLPAVATYVGFVVLTADIVGFEDGRPVLQRPGAWADVVDGRRLPTRPGGRPAYVWLPPRG
jgi:hypothetical protein